MLMHIHLPLSSCTGRCYRGGGRNSSSEFEEDPEPSPGIIPLYVATRFA